MPHWFSIVGVCCSIPGRPGSDKCVDLLQVVASEWPGLISKTGAHTPQEESLLVREDLLRCCQSQQIGEAVLMSVFSYLVKYSDVHIQWNTTVSRWQSLNKSKVGTVGREGLFASTNSLYLLNFIYSAKKQTNNNKK